MGARYIWEKSTIENGYYNYSGEYRTVTHTGGSSDPGIVLFGLKSAPTASGRQSNKYSYSGSYVAHGSMMYPNDAIETDDYPYATVMPTEDAPYTSGTHSGTLSNLSTYLYRKWTHTEWYFAAGDFVEVVNREWNITCINEDIDETYDFYMYTRRSTTYPGDFIEYLTSSSPSTYPSYDSEGSYYYTSEGQDVIDPVSVIIPSFIVHNTTINITMTPSDDALNNSYGNITYDYDYKFNDTDWMTLKHDTTDTSLTLRVPINKTSVQIRCRAKDDLGFTSTTYTTSPETIVYASQPPSAPSSITADRTIAGFLTTVTIGKATDQDGTIVSYILERKVDSGEWSQVQKSSLLTYSEEIDSSWTTVQYRAKAIDDSNVEGPYLETENYNVIKDILVIVGPKIPDFGAKLGNFNLSFYVLVAGDPLSNDITVNALLNGYSIYSGTVSSEEIITIPIDTSSLNRGDNATLDITASKEGYTTVQEIYNFVLANVTLPKGGNMVQFQDSQEKPIVPVGKANGIFLSDGRDLETVITQILSQLET